MKVQATQALAKAIKEETGFNTSLVKMDFSEYKMMVDVDVFAHEIDFNERTNKMQVIKVTYPAECYAMPRYLTTKDLARVFRNSDKTYNGFFRAIANEIEI